MEKVKRFIECLLPVTACNLRCSYCYVIQRNHRNMEMLHLKYPPDVIGQGLRKERMGGICYFSICGAGETLIPKEIVDITREILKQGHFVNLTTNGTISVRIEELMALPEEFLERLHFAFSFHYLELMRVNQMEAFYQNVKKVRKNGCSYMIQLNLCDEYIPYLVQIKKFCLEHFGAYPQIVATRKENNLQDDVELLTKLSQKEYMQIGNEFGSPLFDFTMKNFNLKQKEFCYAGDWTGQLNLETGVFSRCYASVIRQDIFTDINKPIDFCATGKHCSSLFCMNSSHFLSLGAIPSREQNITYAKLRNKDDADWYSERMKKFLNSKLQDSNTRYTALQKVKVEVYAVYELLFRFTRRLYRKIRHR